MAAHRARLLLGDRRTARAAKAVERAWQTAPHPELAQVYGEIQESEAPLARVARLRAPGRPEPQRARKPYCAGGSSADGATLGRGPPPSRARIRRPIHRQPRRSRRARYRPCRCCGRRSSPTRTHYGCGGRSRRRSSPAPARALCLMMARLEEAEHGDLGCMRESGSTTPPGGFQIHAGCLLSCGGENRERQSLCPRCGVSTRSPGGPRLGGSVTRAAGDGRRRPRCRAERRSAELTRPAGARQPVEASAPLSGRKRLGGRTGHTLSLCGSPW